MKSRAVAIGVAAAMLLATTAVVAFAASGSGVAPACTSTCDGTPDQIRDPDRLQDPDQIRDQDRLHDSTVVTVAAIDADQDQARDQVKLQDRDPIQDRLHDSTVVAT